MAHFAQLDENNNVMTVIVVSNDELLDENGQESEEKGINFCKSLLGSDTNWKQTSYNHNFRKNYAGIGSKYDEKLDAFIPPKPYESWLLDEETCRWQPPIPMPDDESCLHFWNEETKNWRTVSKSSEIFRPFPSWTYNSVTHTWEPPVPRPDDKETYRWDETTTSWVLI